MSKSEIFNEIVSQEIYDPWSLSESIINLIYTSDKEEQLSIFTSFLKDIDISDFDLSRFDDQFNLSDDNFEKFLDVAKTASRILQNLIDANVTETEFYEKIWNKLNDADLFPDEDDKKALLLSLWFDARIPYYQLEEGCFMENDEYMELIHQLSPELKRARFIIYSEFEQKTERTSLLMSLADKIEDYRMRVVFWSQTISMITRLEEKINNLQDEDELEDEE